MGWLENVTAIPPLEIIIMPNVQYAQPMTQKKRVYFTGSDELKEGYPLCYVYDSIKDYKGDTDSDMGVSLFCAARRLTVEKPELDNNMHFAGTVAQESAGVTGPAWITMNLPGSVCNIYAYASCDHGASGLLLNTGQQLTFSPGTWYFRDWGYRGTGSATVLQNRDRSTTAGLVMAELQTGPQSGGVYYVLSSHTSSGGVLSTILSNPVQNVGTFVFKSAIMAASTTHVVTSGCFQGQKVMFYCEGALNTAEIKLIISQPINVCPSVNGTITFVSGYVELSKAADFCELEWIGSSAGWKVLSSDSPQILVT